MKTSVKKSVKKSVKTSVSTFTKVGSWSASEYRGRRKYEINDEPVDALPSFDPFGFHLNEVREAVRDCVNDNPNYPTVSGSYEVRACEGDVFRNGDGSYRYDIHHVFAVAEYDWDFDGDDVSVTLTDADNRCEECGDTVDIQTANPNVPLCDACEDELAMEEDDAVAEVRSNWGR